MSRKVRGSERRARIRLAVLNRDKWTCMMPVCKHPTTRAIDSKLDGKHNRWSPTVDHRKPKSKGGKFTPDNLRAAHAICNSFAGNFGYFEDGKYILDPIEALGTTYLVREISGKPPE